MASSAPDSEKAWADGPCASIATPAYTTNKTDTFTTGATHMAHIHNAILRGFNSIFQQAAHVKEEDKAAFIGYTLAWHRLVKSHHHDEEMELFPKVEQLLGTSGIWAETQTEHSSFIAGLASLESYLVTLASPSSFHAPTLLEIMSSFQAPFAHHFHREISTIASFASIPSAPAPDSPEAEAAAAVFKAWGKKTVTKAGTTDVVPFFLLNLDATYEDGVWADWPPMPALVRWGLVNVAGAVHWQWWKFASCDAKGIPRELYALGGSV